MDTGVSVLSFINLLMKIKKIINGMGYGDTNIESFQGRIWPKAGIYEQKLFMGVGSPLPECIIGIYVMSKWRSSPLSKIQEKGMIRKSAFQAV